MGQSTSGRRIAIRLLYIFFRWEMVIIIAREANFSIYYLFFFFNDYDQDKYMFDSVDIVITMFAFVAFNWCALVNQCNLYHSRRAINHNQFQLHAQLRWHLIANMSNPFLVIHSRSIDITLIKQTNSRNNANWNWHWTKMFLIY